MLFVSIYFLTFLTTVTADQQLQEEEFDAEETRTTRTFAKRSDGRSQQVVTGTFRFRRVVNGDSGSGGTDANGRLLSPNSGWDVSGCYCRDGPACSVSTKVQSQFTCISAGLNCQCPLSAATTHHESQCLSALHLDWEEVVVVVVVEEEVKVVSKSNRAACKHRPVKTGAAFATQTDVGAKRADN